MNWELQDKVVHHTQCSITVRSTSSGVGPLGSNPRSTTCWVSIGKLFVLSKLQFPVLRRGNDKVHTSEDCYKD